MANEHTIAPRVICPPEAWGMKAILDYCQEAGSGRAPATSTPARASSYEVCIPTEYGSRRRTLQRDEGSAGGPFSPRGARPAAGECKKA